MQEPPNQIEKQNNENRNTTPLNTTKQTLTHEIKIKVDLIKKIMTEKKTALPSLRSQDRKKVKVEIEKINKLFTIIQTNNITELNELIYAGTKLVCDKIGVPLRNSKIT